ncbi:MAG: helix-turn-helix transcriptional regulator [Methylovulum sp.]
MQNQAALRPKQSANYLAVSIATFWRLVKAGELKTIKLSTRCTGVLKSELDAYLNR